MGLSVARLSAGGRLNPVPLTRALLASTALMSAVAAVPALADGTLPTGASVAAGSVTVSETGNAMTVTQTSDKAIVNWSSFSIGADNSVSFVQPDASSAILNRVTGSTTTTIAGTLTANGQVYLINPNGIVITATGTVDVGGGFVASTLDIDDDDFLNETMTFTGDGASAGVSNEGVITVGRGGFAALLGGTVKNSGLIAVPLGKVGLGSGEQATLDFSGDGFLQVAVATQDGAEGDGALIENSGLISASGGLVVMQAATARNTARQAINLTGTVEADTVAGQSGRIVLGGGSGGKVTVSGTLSASGSALSSAIPQAKPTGGDIEITGQEIALTGATVDASGAYGGGSVKIGGDYQGSGDLQTADTVTIDAETQILADATIDGDGGDVVVWSDELTSFAGSISSTGAGSGSGGDAEVSGKATLVYTGTADLSSASGSFGTLLLDPYNITITDDDGAGSSLTASGDDSTLSVSVLEAALATANVTVTTGNASSEGTQDGNITVASDVTWSANTILTLDAYNDIEINANITATGASAGLVLTYGGDYSIGSGASVTLSGASASLVINGTTYTLIHDQDDLKDVNSTLSGFYALAEDLDLSGTTYTDAVIGSGRSNQFSGTFAGLGHTISNLTISASSTEYIGLFSFSTGTIRDLGLEDVSIIGATYTGGLVGYNFGGTISNAYVTGEVSGSTYTGGLVGFNTGEISNAYATGAVSGSSSSSSYTGGLVGNNYGGTISNAYATGAVSGNYGVGGLVGSNTGEISNAYATGAVSGSTKVGGLVGTNAGTISNAYATGKVSGSSRYTGGLVGYNSFGEISNAYATGAVSGSYYVGGLVGFNRGTISNAYATGAVSGSSSYTGGLVGYNKDGTISNAYATGAVSGSSSSSSYTGGLVGYNTGTITASYFDTESTGQSAGVGSGTTTTGVTGLTSEQARDSSNYTDWDFDKVWYQTGDMRPILRSEAATADSNGVITVSNLHQLALIGADLSATYVLTDDIDASETESTVRSSGIWGASGWVPLGDDSTPFSGTLDGDGHIISNLTISASSTNYIGLFGYSTGTIRDLGLEDVSIIGATYTGGLVGYNYGGTISNAYVTGAVSGSSSSSYTGGLVGFNTGEISNAYATGAVSGSSSSSYTGGLVGYNTGVISNAYATGAVSGFYYVGGLVGTNEGTISNAYATGAVSGNYRVGGLVGNNGGTISNAYATGAVSGSYYVGGLVGFNNRGEISNAYATGAVSISSSSTSVGGLVGYNTGTITASYFDTETTGQSAGVGGGTTTGVTGLTTAEFQDTATFYALASAEGWDFETTWAPSDTGYYPELYALSDVLFVKAGTVTMTYGDTLPDLSYSLYGESGLSDFTTNLTTNASSTANVGTYTITGSTTSYTSTAGTTYRVVTSGTVTVTARAITVTADDLSMTYGDTPSLTYVITSGELVNGDSLTGALATSATSTSSTGTYAITQGTLANSNYAITYVGGTLTVTARAITVTADDLSMTYGDSVPSLTYDITSGELVNGDSLTGALATSATSTSSTGTYAITQGTLAASSNYALTYVGGTLTVTARAITVTADDLSMTYGDSVPSLTYDITSGELVNGDSLTGALATSAISTSSTGTYAITQGTLAASSNYALTYVGGTLTVTGQTSTVTGRTSVVPSAAPAAYFAAESTKTGVSFGSLGGTYNTQVVFYSTDGTGAGTESQAGSQSASSSGSETGFDLGRLEVFIDCLGGLHSSCSQ